MLLYLRKFIMNFNTKTGHAATLLLLAFIWGSSFILMKRGLEVFTPMQVAALRLFFTGLVLLPFAIKYLKFFKGNILWYLAFAGIAGSGIPAFFYTFAQKHIDSSVAGILNALTPLFTLIVAVFLFKTKVLAVNAGGIMLGFIGAGMLIVKDLSTLFDDNNIYGLLIVAATFLYGYNTNHVKHRLKELDGKAITSLSFLTVLPFVSVYLFFSDIGDNFEKPEATEALGYIVILAVAGTALAMIIWNSLIMKLSAIYAASVTYIIPVFAIMWGVIDGEVFGLREVIAMCLIFAGVYLVNIKYEIKNDK